MKGLELAEKYYNEFGAPMIHEQFPEIEGIIAVGLVGSGSECFGYDDDISVDHDFEPGFCIFIPSEDVIDRKTCFRLERAYAKLPSEYLGYKRNLLSPQDGDRHGVIRMDDFFKAKVGSADGKLSIEEWLRLPENNLAEATNGKIFRDDLGVFSDIRNELLNMPTDIRLKRLAGNLMLMAQSGQYNYMRCLERGDFAAARLAAFEYVNAAINTIFLLEGKYRPYYKWTFRALKELACGEKYVSDLEKILCGGATEDEASEIAFVIENVAEKIIDELNSQCLTKAVCGDLKKHAYSVNDAIKDVNIRNYSIFAAV